MLTNKNGRNIRRTGAWSIRYLCLALGLSTLAACADRTTYWSPTESPKKNKVSWAEFHHPVYFTGSSAKLNKAEKEALARFLSRVARGHGVQVMLATGSAKPSALTKRRETTLASHLIASGHSVSRIQAQKSYTPRPGKVRVTVGRYIVTPPACPDWSKDPTGDPANQVTSNYGCANETNLGLMVANPESLIRGTDIGPADGEAVTKGIENYRAGEVEKAGATSARDGAGGGGSGK